MVLHVVCTNSATRPHQYAVVSTLASVEGELLGKQVGASVYDSLRTTKIEGYNGIRLYVRLFRADWMVSVVAAGLVVRYSLLALGVF